jgi:molybdopterin molybdotransferase
MGTVPEAPLLPGQAAPIPTGGFLPRGADAVVMVEYTAPAGGGGVEVYKPVTAGSNVLAKGDDVRAGETVVAAGRILRPQELGLLAALGITTVRVYRPPVAAVVSTGDEIVPAGGSPRPGQVRDANGPSVASLLRASGCRVAASGIVPDNAAALERALRSGLDQADLVVLSGGSSVGLRDLMAEVVAGLDGAEILAHGVSIRPGKPTLLARRREQAIFGLPGHPVSALLVAHAFLVPFVKYLQGGPLRKGPLGERRRAILASPVASTIGLEEYVRVSVEEQAGGGCLAAPVFGNSGMLSTLVKADSVVVVPMNSEGIGMGETVEVIRLS